LPLVFTLSKDARKDDDDFDVPRRMVFILFLVHEFKPDGPLKIFSNLSHLTLSGALQKVLISSLSVTGVRSAS
jgi:hypothetical protein